MAIRQDRAVVVEDTVSPQVNNQGSVYVCIPKRLLRSADIGPETDEIPSEITQRLHKGGERDGQLVLDLKGASDGD